MFQLFHVNLPLNVSDISCKFTSQEVNLHEIAETLRGITQFSSLMEPYGLYPIFYGGRRSRGRDRMAVGFTITCAISAYHH
jgi:hypothetical protein